jgi:hypothetical protein
MMGKLAATLFYLSPKGAKPYHNPFRHPIKTLRAKGARKQARALRRAARDAARDVHTIERRLTKAAESDKVES